MTQLAEVFPIGEHLKEEMATRGWCVAKAAFQVDVTEETMEAILDGRQRITVGLAVCLGRAFGVDPNLFLNLQRTWDEQHGESKEQGTA